jgi:hypothetical protein
MRDRRKFSEISASWLAGRVSIAREDGADDACSGHNRGPGAPIPRLALFSPSAPQQVRIDASSRAEPGDLSRSTGLSNRC